MANLNGQYLDSLTFYKGLINIGSAVGSNLTSSLQSLTDGDGNNLPIQVGIGLVGIEGGTINFTTGTNTRNVLSQGYTINNTGGTNTVTGIKVNAIETSVIGTTHNLMDLQVGGQSRLRYIHTANGGLQITRTDNSYVSAAINNSGIQIHQNLGLTCTYFLPAGGSTHFTLFNWSIGANTVNSARLHVRGDGTNPIARFENKAGVELFGINNSGQITQAITVLGSITGGFGAFSIAYTGGITNNFNSSASSVRLGMYVTHTGAVAAAGIDYRSFGAGSTFNPTSGTGTYITALLNPIINQTGTADGITRGLYINPTLTSAVDFRAIDVEAGSTAAHKLIRLANGAGNKVIEANGNLELGFFGAPPITQPNVTGSRGNPEEALNNLLTAMANLGLIVNTTSA